MLEVLCDVRVELCVCVLGDLIWQVLFRVERGEERHCLSVDICSHENRVDELHNSVALEVNHKTPLEEDIVDMIESICWPESLHTLECTQ